MAAQLVAERHPSASRGAYFAPLRQRNYFLLWVGSAISLLGDNFQTVALPVLILDLIHRPSAVGTILMVQAIPRTLLLIAGGLATDRFRARSVLLVANILQGLVVAALFLLAATARLGFWHLYVYAAAYGAVAAFLLPASRSIIPELVPREQVRSANALSTTMASVARFGAPPVAGMVVALASVAPAFAVDAVSFLLAAAFVGLMRIEPLARTSSAPTSPAATPIPTASQTVPIPAAAASAWRQLREGVQAAHQDDVVRTTLVLASVFFLGYAGAVFVGVPALAKLVLAAGDQGIGTLYGAMGVGALLGALATAAVVRLERPGLVGCLMVVGAGAMLAAAGMAPSMQIAIPLFALVGALSSTSPIIFATLVQTRTSAETRGRVIALLTLGTVGLQPVSYALAGLAGDALGPRALIACGGAVAALAGVFALSQKGMREAK